MRPLCVSQQRDGGLGMRRLLGQDARRQCGHVGPERIGLPLMETHITRTTAPRPTTGWPLPRRPISLIVHPGRSASGFAQLSSTAVVGQDDDAGHAADIGGRAEVAGERRAGQRPGELATMTDTAIHSPARTRPALSTGRGLPPAPQFRPDIASLAKGRNRQVPQLERPKAARQRLPQAVRAPKARLDLIEVNSADEGNGGLSSDG